MNKKQLGLLSLSSVLVLGAAACGSDTTSTPDNDFPTITISADKGYTPYLEKIAVDFESEFDVNVNVVAKDMMEQGEAMKLDGPAGIGPDVFMTTHDGIGSNVAAGIIAPVDFGTQVSEYDAKALEAVTYEGTTYLAPSTIESIILFYNKDLLPTAPATFAELEALTSDPAYAFESEAGRSVAFLAKFVDFYHAYGIVGGYGGYIFGDSIDDIGLDNAGTVAGLEYIQQWDMLMPKGMQDETSSYDFMMQYFNEGKTAAIMNGPWAARDAIDAGVNVGFAQLPTLPNGEQPTPFGGVKGWAISNFSKEKDLANEFVKFATNADNSLTFYEETNEILPNMALLNSINAGDDELAQAIIAQFASAEPMPSVPQMGEIWEFKAALFDVGQGADPQTAATNALKIVKDNIDAKHN